MYERTYGKSYDKTLTTSAIAKLVRQRIASLKKSGELDKGWKISVRSEYFAGGSAIRLNITAVPENVNPFNPAWFNAEARNERTTFHGNPMSRYSDEVVKVQKLIMGIVAEYNYDGSETMADYWDVNFYCNSCDLDWRKFGEQEKAMMQDARAKATSEQQQ